MPEAATAPPPAPSKSPAPPAPAPAAAPNKSDAVPPGAFDKAFAELDELDKAPVRQGATKEPPKSEDRPKIEPPKTEAETALQPGDKPPEAKPDARQKGPTAALKEAYEGLKQKVAREYEPELEKLRAKVKEYEGGTLAEAKQWQDRATAAEKRATELEQEIEFVNFAKSPKFINSYRKPYEEAWGKAVHDFGQLTAKVRTGTDETGEPVFATRKATADDLLMLANMPLSEMDSAAEEMFGKSAPRVIRHVEKIRELSDAQNQALQDAAKNGEERNKTRALESQTQMRERGRLWQENNKTLAERYPKWFTNQDGDEEYNSTLAKGFAEADKLFSPTEENKPKTMEEAVHLHALIRNQSAAFKPTVRLLKRAQARIAELEAELADYKKSEPPAGKAGRSERTTGKTFMQDAEDELDALERASA